MTTRAQKIKKTTIANKAKVDYFCIYAKINAQFLFRNGQAHITLNKRLFRSCLDLYCETFGFYKKTFFRN